MKAHAWKACIRQKRIAGSNPALSVAAPGGASAGRVSLVETGPPGNRSASRRVSPLRCERSILRWSCDADQATLRSSHVRDHRRRRVRVPPRVPPDGRGRAGGRRRPRALVDVAARRGLGRAGRARDDKLTPWEDVTGYNNFYEFGTDKDDPARNAGALRTRPGRSRSTGEVAKPATYDLDDLLKGLTPEERVYRHRCVEGWSMVVPWMGIPLGAADRPAGARPARRSSSSSPRCCDPQQMPGQQRRRAGLAVHRRRCGWTRRATR